MSKLKRTIGGTNVKNWTENQLVKGRVNIPGSGIDLFLVLRIICTDSKIII